MQMCRYSWGILYVILYYVLSFVFVYLLVCLNHVREHNAHNVADTSQEPLFMFTQYLGRKCDLCASDPKIFTHSCPVDMRAERKMTSFVQADKKDTVTHIITSYNRDEQKNISVHAQSI